MQNHPEPMQKVQLCGAEHCLFSLPRLAGRLNSDLSRLPYSIRVLLENLLRHQGGETVTEQDVQRVARYKAGDYNEHEIAFYPSRVLMPDSSGLPLLVDLASMRDRVKALGQAPELINPQIPVDLVVDHAITTDYAGSKDAFSKNLALEYRRNKERYSVLKWAESTFRNLRIIPPGNGILHQINLEYLATVVCEKRGDDGIALLYPDSLVGTDSHTPMINGLGVLGWGVGGIEAGSAMLGEPISMLIPQVVGCRLRGRVKPGVTATDIVLTVTERLRSANVVGKFVEFCGDGLANLALPDRATIANMAPEYGATMGFFPVDAITAGYLRATGRDARAVDLIEAYAKFQGLWREDPEPSYETVVDIDLSCIGASVAGPRRPEGRLDLAAVAQNFAENFNASHTPQQAPAEVKTGDVVIAAITSCTNTSNPNVMIAAGLLARNAVERGLTIPPWVKTSLSPGSRRVSEYLQAAGLDQALDALGFQVAGYGCMTCMGGSGDLKPEVMQSMAETSAPAVAAVLSGNRNFESRIHALVRANYLASPPLVIAYALAGTVLKDLTREPLGLDGQGQAVFLSDIWPTDQEIADTIRSVVVPDLYTKGYKHILDGDSTWNSMKVTGTGTFSWNPDSTYIRPAPYSDRMGTAARPAAIADARIIAMLGDNVTTDHISPVGAIPRDGDVGRYLLTRGVNENEFNLLLSRRANPDVVARTAFSNLQLRNEIVPGVEGGFTRHFPNGDMLSIYDAALHYDAENVPLVVIAGKNYGAGSSRDTAAKGTALIGVRAVIAESFERIHRSNLVGLGVLPLEFPAGTTRLSCKLTGSEQLTILGMEGPLTPRMTLACRFKRQDGSAFELDLLLRVDTPREMRWIDAGGILPFVGNELIAKDGVPA